MFATVLAMIMLITTMVVPTSVNVPAISSYSEDR